MQQSFSDVINIIITYKILYSVCKQKHESLYDNNFNNQIERFCILLLNGIMARFFPVVQLSWTVVWVAQISLFQCICIGAWWSGLQPSSSFQPTICYSIFCFVVK